MRRYGMIVLAVWCLSWAAARADEPALLGRPLSAWIGDLSDSNPETKKKAAATLTLMGSSAKSAVPALLKALGDGDPYVRQYCAYALGQIAGGDAAVVTALRGLLSDRQWFVRSRAADAVSRLGPAAKAALPDLEPLLKDGQPYVRIDAACALWRIDQRAGQATAVFLEAMKDRDEPVAVTAIDGLAEMGPAAAPALYELREVLRHSHSELLRKSAARALGRLGSASRHVVPDLLDLLQSEDRDTQLTALGALAAVRPADPRAVAALVQKLGDSYLGYSAGVALGKAGAVATLVEAMKSADSAVKASAAVGLAAVGPDAVAALPVLLTALKDTSSATRKRAIEAIGAIGPDDSKFAQQLVDVLRADANFDLIHDTGAALRGLGPAAIPVLGRALNDRSISAGVRRSFSMALEKMGADALPAVPELVKALHDPSDDIRLDALEALVHCGPGVPGVIEAIAAAADDESQQVYWTVCNAAFKFGPQLKPAIPKLVARIRKDPGILDVPYAVRALGWIGVGSKEVIDALHAAAAYHRWSASIALWRVGKHDRAMLAQVIEDFGRSPSKPAG